MTKLDHTLVESFSGGHALQNSLECHVELSLFNVTLKYMFTYSSQKLHRPKHGRTSAKYEVCEDEKVDHTFKLAKPHSKFSRP